MLAVYMIAWSLMLIVVLGLSRLRNLGQVLVAAMVTVLMLLVSQSLFIQLSFIAGVPPTLALSDPGQFMAKGLTGWLALLVMPCGWLGPMVGMHIAQRLVPADHGV